MCGFLVSGARRRALDYRERADCDCCACTRQRDDASSEIVEADAVTEPGLSPDLLAAAEYGDSPDLPDYDLLVRV